ncbi:MAG: tetratricopeptide repeat protein [Elusimicrobia bacterium]|nr:tetratricopeptide repeat protein [Elusimicrobiota bacterium]
MGLPFALLAFGLVLPARAAGAAGGEPEVPSLKECAAVRERGRLVSRTGKGDLTALLRDAERCAAAPDLPRSRRAEFLRGAARLRAQSGDSVGVEKALKRALELEPDDAEAAFALAEALRDRPAEALPYAELAARSGATARRRAAAHRLSAEIRLDMDDAAGARASLERALSLADRDLEALQVMVRAERGRPLAAAGYAARASKAADAAPRWLRPAADRLCARIWLELADYPEAIACLRRALGVNHDDLDALEALVEIKRARPQETAAASGIPSADRPARSEAALMPALQADPEDLEALRQLIEIRRGQQRLVEAEGLAGRLMDAVPKAPAWQHVAAYTMLTEVWLELGDAEMARQSIRHARDLDPRSLVVLTTAARLGVGEGQGDDASPADAHAAVARALISLEDTAGAEASLKAALEVVPEHLQALEVFARLRLAEGRPREALAFSDRLLKASEAKTPVTWELAGRYNRLPWEHASVYEQRAQIELELGDEAAARQSLERALALVPEDPAALRVSIELNLRAALARRQAKDEAGRKRSLSDALMFCGRALKAMEKAPLDERARVIEQQAEIERELGDEAAAEASLNRALDLVPGKRQGEPQGQQEPPVPSAGALAAPPPERLQALEMLVQLAMDAHRPQQALAACERALAAAEKSSPAERAGLYTQRARISRELGDADGAAKSLEQALALSPDDSQALRTLAQIESGRGRPREALRWARSLVKVSGKAPAAARADAYRQKAQIELDLGDDASAREDFKRVLAAAPEDWGSLWMLLSAGRAEPREGLALVEAHRPQAGPTGPWLALRGLARAKLKDRAGAEEDLRAAAEADAKEVCLGPLFQAHRDRLDPLYFDRCVEKFPDEPKLFADRGVARYACGQAEAAVADFRKAAELRPDDLQALVSLASALEAADRREEALREADRAAGLAKGREGAILGQIETLRKRLRASATKP